MTDMDRGMGPLEKKKKKRSSIPCQIQTIIDKGDKGRWREPNVTSSTKERLVGSGPSMDTMDTNTTSKTRRGPGVCPIVRP